MNLPSYSVLMSVYVKERPEFLRESINSMLSQTVLPDEIVLVEDGPLTEELYSVINEFKQSQGEIIKTVKLSENMGLGKALNCGLKVCKNDLVARMDTDDIALPDRCRKQLMKFVENENLCILGTQINEFICNPENIVSSRMVPCSFEEISQFAKRRSPFNHPTVMYKKSVILEHGGYSEYGRKEDLDLFLRLVFEGCYCENLDEKLLLYRTSEDNLKRRTTWINCSEYISIMNKFYKAGKLGFKDICYVVLGQTAMFICPSFISDKLSKKFLRH